MRKNEFVELKNRINIDEDKTNYINFIIKTNLNKLNGVVISEENIQRRIEKLELFIVKKILTDNQKMVMSKNQFNWKFAAKVLDRFFFLLSILYVLVTFVSFILMAKNFYMAV